MLGNKESSQTVFIHIKWLSIYREWWQKRPSHKPCEAISFQISAYLVIPNKESKHKKIWYAQVLLLNCFIWPRRHQPIIARLFIEDNGSPEQDPPKIIQEKDIEPTPDANWSINSYWCQDVPIILFLDTLYIARQGNQLLRN